jgi:hypothetical protein
VKANSRNATGKKLEGVHFLFFDLKSDNIQTEISRINFERAQNLASKKALGQDLSIGPSLDQIGLTNAEK